MTAETSPFHLLEAQKPNGEKLPFTAFKSKVVLVVNTATKCGLTPQFEGLERLHQDYKNKGLIVLGFPCNQFMGQEPLSNENMEESCRINHGVSFQLTKKVDVNGQDTDPVFAYLKDALKGTLGKRIVWNFTKFLIDKEGKPYKRFGPKTQPNAIEKDIQLLIT